MTEGGKDKYLILALPFFPLISFFSKLLSHFFYLNLTSFISDHEFFMKILSSGQTVLRSVPFLIRIQHSHWPYVAHRGHCRTLGAGIVKCPHVTCCGPTQDAPVTSSLGAGLAGGGRGSCSLLHPCCIWPRVGAQGISAELTHNFGIYINFRWDNQTFDQGESFGFVASVWKISHLTIEILIIPNYRHYLLW